MELFEFSHQIPRHIEFVNGSYSLTEIKTLVFGGKSILYCLGEATLDNSCCGSTDCAYAMVIGEIIKTEQQTNGSPAVSTLKRFTQPSEEQKIRLAIQAAEHLETVNFYLPEQLNP